MHLPFPRPSTRAFLREGRRRPAYSLFDALHGYVYARWTYLYIGIGTGQHPLARVVRPVAAWFERHASAKPSLGRGEAFLQRAAAAAGIPLGKWCPVAPSSSGNASPLQATGQRKSERLTFADTYHGKVVTLDAAVQLVSVNQEISLPDLEHVIPYPIARDLILKNPDHIVALECPCRSARANPCLPLDVCLIVGEPFASFVAEHHRHRSRWIDADEAAAILAAEHARGHVSHAFFKDAMLGRFYAICNCCSCCCGAMQAHRSGVPMLASSGYVAQVDPGRCVGCGICAQRCQFGAIHVSGKSEIDAAACMGCGVCVSGCADGALSLVRDPTRAAPLEIDLLMDQRCA